MYFNVNKITFLQFMNSACMQYMYIAGTARKLILSKELPCLQSVYVNYMHHSPRFDWEWGLIYRSLLHSTIHFNTDTRHSRPLILMLFSWIGVAPSLYKLRKTLLFEDLNQINWCIVFSYLVPSIKKIDDVFKKKNNCKVWSFWQNLNILTKS